jgi:hypothetical protein
MSSKAMMIWGVILANSSCAAYALGKQDPKAFVISSAVTGGVMIWVGFLRWFIDNRP